MFTRNHTEDDPDDDGKKKQYIPPGRGVNKYSKVHIIKSYGIWVYDTSIKYKVECDERYLPYIELGRWLCSHFQLETPLNFHKPITQKLYNIEK